MEYFLKFYCVLSSREEFYDKDRPTSGPRGLGPVGGIAANWHSGLFDFGTDDDIFWRKPQSSVSSKGQADRSDKESGADDNNDREPLDVEFVSGTIGGEPAGGETDIALSGGPSGFPIFPFGGNFGGFGPGFPFNFGGPTFKPWWKG